MIFSVVAHDYEQLGIELSIHRYISLSRSQSHIIDKLMGFEKRVRERKSNYKSTIMVMRGDRKIPAKMLVHAIFYTFKCIFMRIFCWINYSFCCETTYSWAILFTIHMFASVRRLKGTKDHVQSIVNCTLNHCLFLSHLVFVFFTGLLSNNRHIPKWVSWNSFDLQFTPHVLCTAQLLAWDVEYCFFLFPFFFCVFVKIAK